MTPKQRQELVMVMAIFVPALAYLFITREK